MFVKLLQTILEGKSTKTVVRPGRDPVVFVKGAVVEMSEATAAKYIAAGKAEAYTEQVADE